MTSFRFDPQLYNNRQQPSTLARRAGRTRTLYRQAAELGLQLSDISGRLSVSRDGNTLVTGSAEVVAAFLNRHRLTVRRYEG